MAEIVGEAVVIINHDDRTLLLLRGIEAFVATCLLTQTPIPSHRGNRTKIEPLIRLTPKTPRFSETYWSN